MAKPDWDYARDAEWWTVEEFCEFIHPDDPSARPKLDVLTRRAVAARKLSHQIVRRPGRFLAGTPDWKKYIIYLTQRAEALAWAQGTGRTIHSELEELMARPATLQTPVDRAARIAARHEELKAGGDRHPTKTLAEEQGKSESWIRQLIAKARKSR